ncbi:glycosyltransferase involved in cell wall biosynthesis [Mucilaginibacter gracilis]|uniref:Glycosyltransferase involved in cell wall biosynthesis n=1 Tax=Mucilaginibacter gracilis TaxID=423350 RepID=A0A495IYE2_9SPHI|nr:glycosyltransferase [Mucilaginibacter gracilis]RKR81074.1 glycosyltransferase involved in cell wall biosynthesis [Mucilaginibacter gracilis]
MEISYITSYDSKDVHKWSGLGYYIAKGLEAQNNNLDYISIIKPRTPIAILKKIFYKSLGKGFLFDRIPSESKIFADEAKKKIKQNTDIVFSPGSTIFSYLETNKPKVFYTDATFAGMIDFYKSFTNLSRETIENGTMLEKTALNNCDLAIYSSDWAAQSAIDNYGINPQKVKVVPFGANIDSDRNLNDIKTIVSKKNYYTCNLLFVGVEWERKGGPLALDVTKRLNEMGLKTTLHVVGLPKLPLKNIPPYVVNHGFVSKGNAEGKQRLDNLFTNAHFLIVPSLAEAYGLVFCEAGSFGLPAISTNVGGIPTIVKNNINGQLFDLGTPAVKYSDYIYNTLNNPQVYQELCISSFNRYEQELTWNSAGKKLTALLDDVR